MPVGLFIIAALALYWLNIGYVYESQALLTTLNTLFCCSVSLLIVYLAARSYLETGSRAVLVLGCGMLIFATINLVAGVLLTDRNAVLTIYNGGIFLAGLCFAGSALLSMVQKPRQAVPPMAPFYLGFSFLATVTVMGVLILGSLAGMFPAFYVEGQGFTLLRQAVLGFAMIEFALASVCFGIIYRQSRNPFMWWYSLGVLLIGMSTGTLIIVGNLGTMLNWLARGGLYLGGLYMLIAVWSLTWGSDLRLPLEKALRETEDRYRTLFNGMTEGFALHEILCDEKGSPKDYRFLDINPAFEQHTGLKRENVAGKLKSEVLPNDDPIWLKVYGEVALTGKPVHFENYSSALNKYYEVYAYRPAMHQFAVIFTEITERKRAEEAIRGSEARFQVLIKNLRSGVALIDEAGRFAIVNPAFMRMFGLDSELDILNVNNQDWSRWEVYGEGGNLLHIDDHPVRKAAMTGKPVKNQLVAVRNPGSSMLTWMLISAEPMLNKDGICSMVICTYHDITERRQADAEKERLLDQLKAKRSDLERLNEELEVKNEELAAQSEELECANEELRTNNEDMHRVAGSLKEAQDYLESLISYANAPIIVWDPKFTITRFNQAFERLSGYMANEVLGRDLSMLFPLESRDESLEKIKKTLEGEHWESVEIPIRHKFGSIRIALWNSANIYGSNDALQATIAQGQDITARKQAEKELEEEKAHTELYLDLMGHDISNLHQIAMMQLEMAMEIMRIKGKLEGEDKELVEVPLKTLERAARLIENVRKLQKQESGEYRMEIVDMARVLEEAMNVYSNIPGRNIKISYTPKGSYLVRANSLLKDIFSNLMDNAIKHSGDPLEIGVEVDKVGQNGSSYYRLAIEDNGNGIPDDRKAEVFQRFKRGQTSAKGTGLGLHLVRSLVESFGGYVEVQNRVLGDYTRGTRFIIYLPAYADEGAEKS